MPELLRLADSVEADIFSVKTLRPYDYRGHDVDNELVPLHPKLARYAYEKSKTEKNLQRIQEIGKLNCGKPFYAPTLNSDGQLVFCSYASYEDEFFGNLAESSFRKVWNSSASRRKRLEFKHRQGTRSCETCYFRIKHKPTMLHTVLLRELPEDLQLERPETRESFLGSLG
jgi:radical SAM protein with 4Fe4S-binding SPASM domain